MLAQLYPPLCLQQSVIIIGYQTTTIGVLKGRFNVRPIKSIYTQLTHPDTVYIQLAEKFPHRELTLQMRTFKVVMLLSPFSCHLIHTLYSNKVQDIHKEGDGYSIM